MIASQIVQEIRRLLAEGKLSQRKIADRTRVSRGTVAAIAGGKRTDQRPPRPAGKQPIPLDTAGPLQRCPGCGGMVSKPCRLCRTLSIKANAPKLPARLRSRPVDGPLGAGALGLGLNEEHRARYQQVRARRVEAELAALRPLNGEQPQGEDDEADFDGFDSCLAADIDYAEAFDGPDFEDIHDWDQLPAATR